MCLAYLGARPRLTLILKARVEQQYPGLVDWAKVEEQLVALGRQAVDAGRATPQRPVCVADRDAYRYLWSRFARPMLARSDLGELLREPLRLRPEAERVFEALRAALDTAREVRQGRQTVAAVARCFPERLATVQALLDELAREDEATARARERARAARQGSPGRRR